MGAPAIQRAIVVGASSGMGAELARQLAARGAIVAGIARRETQLQALKAELGDSFFPYVHDVQQTDETPVVFERVCHDLGGLDLIIYAAGVMPTIGPDEFNTVKDREIFAVNVTGAIAWLNLAATRFQARQGGIIVGIGSVAGDRGRQGQPGYNASKAALATYLEALRNRLSRHGVIVSTVKPGPVDTPMTQQAGIKASMTAEDAASRILKRCLKTGEHYLKPSHRVIFGIIRRVPSPLFRRLKI